MKLALKPFFKRGEVSKDEYKLIMKKSVDKVCLFCFFLALRASFTCEADSDVFLQIKESSSSVDRERVVRLIKKYVKKIKNANANASTSS